MQSTIAQPAVIDKIAEAIEAIEGVDCVNRLDNALSFRFDGIPIAAFLTNEDPQRLRFSVDLCALNCLPCVSSLDDEASMGEAMFNLLDINTEIDPVAAAIDSTDAENPMVQARTTLRVVDLQSEEIVAEIKGLVGAVAQIHDVISQV